MAEWSLDELAMYLLLALVYQHEVDYSTKYMSAECASSGTQLLVINQMRSNLHVLHTVHLDTTQKAVFIDAITPLDLLIGSCATKQLRKKKKVAIVRYYTSDLGQ